MRSIFKLAAYALVATLVASKDDGCVSLGCPQGRLLPAQWFI